MKQKLNINFFENRILILKILVVIIGIVFALRLIDLQIINGASYREQSEKKMLRETTIEAPRGEIYDRNGVVLATSKLAYDVEIFKVGDENLNNTLLKLLNILEQNKDEYTSAFPMEDNEFYSDEDRKKVCETYDIDSNSTTAEILDHLYIKYDLNKLNVSNETKNKLVALRYEIGTNPFSLFRSVTLAKDVSYNSMAMIEELASELPGIDINVNSKRYYPNGTIAAHLLGYVSKISSEEYKELKDEGYTYNSIIGKMGIETTMEAFLKGSNGIKRTEVDAEGEIAGEYIYKEADSGNNVTLTIDYRLQQVAEKNLKKVINNIRTGAPGYSKKSDATSGVVVAIDVNSAEILAMASYPTFDPNEFVSGIKYSSWKKIMANTSKPMFNRAISGTYSPGSTFKMLSALAGLDSGVITTGEKIKANGRYEYANHPMCWVYSYYGRTHGWVNVSDAIKVSCNCFFYEVGRRMGIDNLVKYCQMFGLGNKTGVELYGESKGMIAGADKEMDWYLGDTLSAVIGQSYNSFTPVQLANYIATLANGGTLNRATLIKNVVNAEDEYVSSEDLLAHIEKVTGYKFISTRLDLNQKHVDAVVEGMKSVTSEQGGTSYIVFKNSDIEVAGKTGTAQVSSGHPNGVFVGFAPIENPQIAVVAIVEHGDSGTAVANIVKPILEEYFNISNENVNKEVNEVLVPSIKY
ncbi:MAG: penicillin-binding protein 2 [Clostridia bacterium]|nr:penicillin-binding protein 2 [Clostridia bacterium]